MAWADETATETQVSHLRKLGWNPDRVLTKREAISLINQYEEHPSRPREKPRYAGPESAQKREAVERARREAESSTGATEELAQAILQRQEFWLDTCREITQRRTASQQVLSLYQQFGCRFFTPTHETVQGIFDALDTAMPVWDSVHPDIFYQTLELNFPDLVRHR